MVKIFDLIDKVKKINPLILHYTNNVTITDCANATLAIGASPLMSFSYEEVDDIVKVSSAVVINIGTMNSQILDLFVLAGKTANKYNKPVILDPKLEVNLLISYLMKLSLMLLEVTYQKYNF